MVSFQYCSGGPSQYNKRRKNEVCELGRNRALLNAMITINLTLKLGEGGGALFPKFESLVYPLLVLHFCVRSIFLFTKYNSLFFLNIA